jgi:hypothetical protein
LRAERGSLGLEDGHQGPHCVAGLVSIKGLLHRSHVLFTDIFHLQSIKNKLKIIPNLIVYSRVADPH